MTTMTDMPTCPMCGKPMGWAEHKQTIRLDCVNKYCPHEVVIQVCGEGTLKQKSALAISRLSGHRVSAEVMEDLRAFIGNAIGTHGDGVVCSEKTCPHKQHGRRLLSQLAEGE